MQTYLHIWEVLNVNIPILQIILIQSLVKLQSFNKAYNDLKNQYFLSEKVDEESGDETEMLK